MDRQKPKLATSPVVTATLPTQGWPQKAPPEIQLSFWFRHHHLTSTGRRFCHIFSHWLEHQLAEGSAFQESGGIFIRGCSRSHLDFKILSSGTWSPLTMKLSFALQDWLLCTLRLGMDCYHHLQPHLGGGGACSGLKLRREAEKSTKKNMTNQPSGMIVSLIWTLN